MNIQIDIPDNESGNWKIETIEVSEQDARFHNIRCIVNGDSNRSVSAGTYKKLTRGGQVVMSNTPAEIRDHMTFINLAKEKGGHILINGLGLGVALTEILNSDKVTKVTVVEKSQDVINLVADFYTKDKRVEIVHEDAFDYEIQADTKYSCVWHDIWDEICGDNEKEMDDLRHKYQKYSEWQGCWCERETIRQNR